MPKSVIMYLTGHKTSIVFDRYNTIDEEDARDALKKFKEFLKNQEQQGVVANECSHSAPKGVER